jgi:hypothetical protein
MFFSLCRTKTSVDVADSILREKDRTIEIQREHIENLREQYNQLKYMMNGMKADLDAFMERPTPTQQRVDTPIPKLPETANKNDIIRDLVENVASTYCGMTRSKTSIHPHAWTDNEQYTVVFESSYSGDITIHGIAKGVSYESILPNLLSAPLKIHVKKDEGKSLGYGIVCFTYTVSGDLYFTFERNER